MELRMFKKARYVYEVYREGNFTKAAKKLGISQPCLSSAIKGIEQSIGSPLFERIGYPIIPTEVGLEYIKSAEKIIAIEDAFALKINDMNSLECGIVRIGGTNYGSSYILPVIINAFYKRFPNVTISMVEANSVELMRMLDDGEVDLIIDSFDSEPDHCAFTPLFREKIILAVPEGFAVNESIKQNAITPARLYDSKFDCSLLAKIPFGTFGSEQFILLKNGNIMYEHAMRLFRESGCTPKVGLYIDQLSTSYSLASQGHGCCFITDTVFRYHRYEDPMLLYNVGEMGEARTFGIAHKNNKHMTPAMHRLIDIARQTLT